MLATALRTGGIGFLLGPAACNSEFGGDPDAATDITVHDLREALRRAPSLPRSMDEVLRLLPPDERREHRRDGYGSPIRYLSYGRQYEFRSPGADRELNTDDDFVLRDSIAAPPPSTTTARPSRAPDPVGCLPLWPGKVALSGVFRTEERQGPPNYGETPEQDMDLSIYLVELDSPRDVCGSGAIPDQPLDPVAGVRTIQLVGNLSGNWLREAVGRRIDVHGDLEHAFFGTHYFPIIMDVDSAAPGW